MTRRAYPEDGFHMAVAQFLDLALPRDAAWTTVECGGERPTREAERLKAKGVKPGWPDVQIVYRGRLIVIELKAPGKTPSKIQKAMHEQLILAGALVYPAATRLEHVEGFLSAIMPLRATTGSLAVRGEAA